VSVTPPEWLLLRILTFHRVMIVARGGQRAREASLLRERRLLSVERMGDDKAIIRITDAGRAEADKIAEELSHVDPK